MLDRSATTGTSQEFEDYKNLLNHVFDTAPIGLCLLDKELRYQHINEWLASINGMSVEEHLGRSINEVIPEVSEQVEILAERDQAGPRG